MEVKVVDPRLQVRSPVPVRGGRPQGTAKVPAGRSFAEVLSEAQKGQVTFSKHAEERLQSWGQVMDGDRLAKLGDAVDVASAKGARSTLVLMKGVAFVVAPQTRTVVTVIPEERMKENVFTSIDSAVVVDR
ncbi:MAG: TIGR02530 family flagellar biosynthesis protein [Bacillota bacterium]|jgi:flagellar operon protein